MNTKFWLILATTLSAGMITLRTAAAEATPAPAVPTAPPAPAVEPAAPPSTSTPAVAPVPAAPPAAAASAARADASSETPAAAKSKPEAKPEPKPAPATRSSSQTVFAGAPNLKPGPAIVHATHVNVRGQPTIYSEVVARLRQNQEVQILDIINREKRKPDEPQYWAKIALPKDTPVWVHGDYVDPETKKVKATLLNVRGGPGENYSILGRLPQGTVVKELGSKGWWLRIEPPEGTYGFVAAYLLEQKPEAITPPPVEVAKTTETTPVVPTMAPPERVEVVETPVAEAVTNVAVGTEPSTVVTQPPVILVPPTPGTAEGPTTTAEATKPEAPEEEAPLERIVVREGIVRPTFSVQAPTYYALKSLDTGRTINFLYSPSTNIVLKNYDGQRILVTGAEYLDERWPKTPVISIESIRTVP